MSVRKLASSTTPYTTGLGTRVISSTSNIPWTRNKSWLSITAPTSSDQKFIGLHAVWPDSNFLALQVTCAGGYTVDWGDGVIEDWPSTIPAEHEYNFSDVDLANTDAPVTLQGGADTVTRSSHGYVNGDTVKLYNIVTTTGISADNPYYVISATTNTFQLSLTSDGTAIDLVSDGSATLLPYKQVIVQVYPTPGNNITALNLHRRHSSLSTIHSSGFLDIALAGSNITDLRIGAPTPGSSSPTIAFRSLEQVNIVRTDCRQLNSLFLNCSTLQSVIDVGTSTAPAATIAVTFTDSTDTVNATAHGFRNGDSVIFSSITSTTGITTYTRYYVINATSDTFQVTATYDATVVVLTTDGSGVAVRGTDMSNLFFSCVGLKSVPLLNTAAVTNMNSMFNFCYALRSVPLFDTAAVTNMGYMFNNCSSLPFVPLLNTSAVTNMGFMFSGCNSLQSVPLFNTSAVTDISNMFNNCRALQSVPLFNTVTVTNISSMFTGCHSLQSVPLFDTAAVTNMSNMLSNCYSLQSVPLFNTASVTNMSSMFSGCFLLQSVPLFNTASVTNMSNMLINCSSLQSVPLFNTAAVTNMGSMFNNCRALQSVPLFNTASVTDMFNMFSGCISLQTVPLFNTAAVTSMQQMFSSCTSLKTVPLLNTAAVTSMSNMFSNCTSLQSVPALVTSTPTVSAAFTNMFINCPSLSKIQATGFRFTFSVASCKLSATALNEIYTNLPTVSSQTITVTGNYGVATDNIAIATAKGWTVSG